MRPETIVIAVLLAATAALCAVLLFALGRDGRLTLRQRRMMYRIFISSVILLSLELFGTTWAVCADNYIHPQAGRWIRLALYLGNYLLIGYDILRKAAHGLLHGRILDENFLMAIATVGAFALGIYQDGDYLEAVAVLLFYQLGEWFQSYAVGRSRRSIAEMMDLRPDSATLETENGLSRVSPENVPVGCVILVLPGERIPLDGCVVDGASSLDTSALTGESLPCDVGLGDRVVSGCINLSGMLRIRTTKPAGESTVQKILDLVQNVGAKKSRSEAFISRFARVYTPAVCAAAIALCLLPPAIRVFVLDLSPDMGTWVYRALSFLVISCPCALVISIPLSFFAGIGGAGKVGILIKGSHYLETLAKTRCVVFDKTGTLTVGTFRVTSLMPVKEAVSDTDIDHVATAHLLTLAAYAESASSHPIGRSLVAAYIEQAGKDVDHSLVHNITEVSGRGLSAMVTDPMTMCAQTVFVGSETFLRENHIEPAPVALPGTTIHVAADGRYLGYICISDESKPAAGQAIRELHRVGVSRTVMLTGDRKAVADAVAAELGIDEVKSELLPHEKVEAIESILDDAEKARRRAAVVFVGDGINDAPVLARADVGVAMGVMGSDAAIEAADVVLMDDDPCKLVDAIRIARRCLRIVRQNIALALTVKALCLFLGAFGVGGMYLAIFADVGVMVLAVLNAMRCLWVKKKEET